MSYFNTNYKNWIIGFLILLNIGTLSFMWIMRPPPPDGPGRRGGPPLPQGFLAKELGFDNQQAAELKSLMDDYFQQSRKIHSQIRQNKKDIFKLIQVDIPDSVAIQEMIQEKSRLHSEEENLFVDHYQAIRKICRDDQIENLNRVFGKAMGPPPLRRRPPPNRRD